LEEPVHVDDFDISPNKIRKAARKVIEATTCGERHTQASSERGVSRRTPGDLLTVIEDVKARVSCELPGDQRKCAAIAWWREPFTIKTWLGTFVGPAWAVIVAFIVSLVIVAPAIVVGNGHVLNYLTEQRTVANGKVKTASPSQP
jgi:hypothetical protein